MCHLSFKFIYVNVGKCQRACTFDSSGTCTYDLGALINHSSLTRCFVTVPKQRCCSALQLITKPKISSIREMRIRHTINFSCVIPLAANRRSVSRRPHCRTSRRQSSVTKWNAVFSLTIARASAYTTGPSTAEKVCRGSHTRCLTATADLIYDKLQTPVASSGTGHRRLSLWMIGVFRG